MPNAKLLIELEGVEAGSRECGGCDLEDGHSIFDIDALHCTAFRGEYRERNANGKYLRCSACLAAEEAAKALGPKPSTMLRITVEPWEADEYIVCVDGSPTGGTISRDDANALKRWLESSILKRILSRVIGEAKEPS